jgi:hypothetical protein
MRSAVYRHLKVNGSTHKNAEIQPGDKFQRSLSEI